MGKKISQNSDTKTSSLNVPSQEYGDRDTAAFRQTDTTTNWKTKGNRLREEKGGDMKETYIQRKQSDNLTMRHTKYREQNGARGEERREKERLRGIILTSTNFLAHQLPQHVSGSNSDTHSLFHQASVHRKCVCMCV